HDFLGPFRPAIRRLQRTAPEAAKGWHFSGHVVCNLYVRVQFVRNRQLLSLINLPLVGYGSDENLLAGTGRRRTGIRAAVRTAGAATALPGAFLDGEGKRFGTICFSIG